MLVQQQQHRLKEEQASQIQHACQSMRRQELLNACKAIA